MNQATSTRFISKQLLESCARAASGEYEESLAILKVVKAYDPGNSYVHSMELYVAKLLKAHKDKVLSEELRIEMIRLLTEVLHRAIERANNPEHTGTGDARSTMLEILKNSFIRRAEEFLRKRQYGFARAEIHRIYLLDPENRIAKHLELRIRNEAPMESDPGSQRSITRLAPLLLKG